MLKPEVLVDFLKDNHVTFYSGVPDSLLKDFCAYVDDVFPKDCLLYTSDAADE